MVIVKNAVAGTLESSDVMVQVAPAPDDDLSIEIHSTVAAGYYDAIKNTAQRILDKHGIKNGEIIINDKGALDFVLVARIEAALQRSYEAEATN